MVRGKRQPPTRARGRSRTLRRLADAVRRRRAGRDAATVVEVARTGQTVAPDAAAEVGLDLVLASDSRRIPVVDGDGVLHGVLAVTSDLRYFACRDRAVR